MFRGAAESPKSEEQTPEGRVGVTKLQLNGVTGFEKVSWIEFPSINAVRFIGAEFIKLKQFTLSVTGALFIVPIAEGGVSITQLWSFGLDKIDTE
ncbi:hypothetical protein DLM77_12510 [Leptospira yasudae]|uniref:Uncharacterized protein n=1 Tax=Leptospira yasudae TaxID=2202201 RepID=A0ABX9M2Z7_9LEPT|nr:hypothetical protein DLM77_12510 [Leptospira yasudae]